MKISLNRAIGELALLEKKISKANEKLMIAYKKESESSYRGYTVEELKEGLQAAIQQATDLIKRKTKLKTAISIANATNEVNFLGKKMTISEVLVIKDFVLKNKKDLLATMKKQSSDAYGYVNNQNETLEMQAERQLQIFNEKSSKELENIKKQYMEGKKYEIITVPEFEKTIKLLEGEIEQLEGEVNFVLTDANAKIEIDID